MGKKNHNLYLNFGLIVPLIIFLSSFYSFYVPEITKAEIMALCFFVRILAEIKY